MGKKYNAFISYRHLERDKAVAQKLQYLLERIRHPEIRERFGRDNLVIFRDEDELPIDSNLTGALERALDESDYLIVILSESYSDSKWCLQEIEYFKSIHHGSLSHVFPVVIEGSHSEVVPDILKHEVRQVLNEDGTTEEREVMIEPLCCDLRADTLGGSLKKLKAREYLRIAAPLIGVSFDTLYQRSRRRKRKQVFAMAAAASLVIAGYLGILIRNNIQMRQKNLELTLQKEELQRNESRLLTESAEEALNQGEYRKALHNALEALPAQEDDRPYYAKAENMLMKALNVFEPGDRSFLITNSLEQNLDMNDFLMDRDGRHVYTVNFLGGVSCYDLYTQELVWYTDLHLGSYSSARLTSFIYGEKTGRLFVKGLVLSDDQDTAGYNVSAVDTDTGEVIWTSGIHSTSVWEVALSADEKTVIGTELASSVFLLDAETGEETDYVLSAASALKTNEHPDITGGLLLWDDSSVRLLDIKTGQEEIITDRLPGIYMTEQAYYNREEKRIYVVGGPVNNSDISVSLVCLDVEKKEILWTATSPERQEGEASLLGGSTHSVYQPEYHTLIAGRGHHLFSFDTDTGAVKARLTRDGEVTSYGKDIADIFAIEDDPFFCAVLTSNGWYSLIYTGDDSLEILAEEHFDNLYSAEIWGGGLYNETPDGQNGKVLWMASDAQNILHVLEFCSISNPLETANVPVNSELIHDEDNTLSIAAAFPREDSFDLVGFESQRVAPAYQKDYVYLYEQIDMETLEVKEHRFSLENPEIGDQDNDLMPLPDGRGLLIGRNNGDLCLFDTESEKVTTLWKPNNEKGFKYTQRRIGNDINVTFRQLSRMTDGTVLAARCDGKQLHLWLNGIEQGPVDLPEGVRWLTRDEYSAHRMLAVGGNGQVIIADMSDREDGYVEQFALYSIKEGKWHLIPDEVRGIYIRLIAPANTSDSFAVVDNGAVRIYRAGEEDRCVMTIPLEYAGKAVRQVDFTQSDEELFISYYHNNKHWIHFLNTKNGEDLFGYEFSGFSEYALKTSLYSDRENMRLYLTNGTSGQTINTGLCIDTQTWTVLSTVNRLLGYHEESNSVLFTTEDGMLHRMIPSTGKLMEYATEILKKIEHTE